jgi:hypothetical protein
VLPVRIMGRGQWETAPGLPWFSPHVSFTFAVFFFFFAVPGLELRAYTFSQSTSPFCDGVFRDGGYFELFSWAGFESQSS